MHKNVDVYQVKCITVMEETFEVYAESEEEAKEIVLNSDPDPILKEQNVISQDNFRISKVEDNASFSKIYYKIFNDKEHIDNSWCYAYQLEGVQAVLRNHNMCLEVYKSEAL